MGAWGYRILENDEALDTMDELNKMLENPLIKENICYRVEYLLNSSENLDDILLCIGLIDASINGTDVNILGSYDYYNNLFNYIKTKPMYNLKAKALKRLESVKRSDTLAGWADECIEPRENLINQLKKRLN